MWSRSMLSCVFMLLVCGGGSAAAQSADPSWLIQVSGTILGNSANFVNWYSVPATTPPYVGSEAATNGIRSPSVGVDAAVEYRLAPRFGLGVAVSVAPTPLEAAVHYTTPTGIVIADPEASILFVPLRATASYDLVRGAKWRLRAGGQVGVGLYGSTDAIPEVGRARHFTGGNKGLVGAHIGGHFTGSKGWGATFTLQYLRTGLEVAELGTGDLPQSLIHESFGVLIGVHRYFGRRR